MFVAWNPPPLKHRHVSGGLYGRTPSVSEVERRGILAYGPPLFACSDTTYILITLHLPSCNLKDGSAIGKEGEKLRSAVQNGAKFS